MTVGVDDELRIREYPGDDSATARAYGFKILDPDDLKVTRTNADGSETVLVRGTDYTVSGAGNPSGGNVTPLAPIVTGTSWRIEGDMPLAQPTDYTAGDDFPAESHERGLDRSMIAHQEARRDINDTTLRALLVPRGEEAAVLPAAADRAGKFQAYDAEGNPIAASGTGADGALREDLAVDGIPLVGGLEVALNAISGDLVDVTGQVGEVYAGVRAIPDPAFNYVPGGLISCAGPGNATFDFQCDAEFRRKYAGLMGGEEYLARAYVDPVNGSDAAAGTRQAPFQTVKKAAQKVGLGEIFLLPGRYTERLDIRASDNLTGGGTIARAMVIRAVGPKGSVVWANPGEQPTDIVWTLDGTLTYEGTPATIDYGAGAVVPEAESILYIKDGAEELVPHRVDRAAIDAVGYGWTQDGAGLISIRWGGLDLTTADTDDLEILYRRPSAWLIYGARVCIKDVVFRGGQEILVDYEDDHRPHLALQNCSLSLSYGNAITTRGALLWLQDVEIDRCSYDGLNYYNRAGAATQGTEAIEVDVLAHHCGPPEVRLWTENPARNRQGSSGHEDTVVVRITTKRSAVYELNSGQNIADTNSTKAWMIATLLGSPFGYLNGGDVALLDGFYDNLQIEGEAWLDNVAILDKGMTRYGLVAAENSSVHVNNVRLSGQTAATTILAGATIVAFDPRTGADLP